MRPIFRMVLAFRIIMFIACQNSTHSEEQNVSFEEKGHLILHTLITTTALTRLREIRWPGCALTRLQIHADALAVHWPDCVNMRSTGCALTRLCDYALARLSKYALTTLSKYALTRLCKNALIRLHAYAPTYCAKMRWLDCANMHWPDGRRAYT